jgi:hypothetical protein
MAEDIEDVNMWLVLLVATIAHLDMRTIAGTLRFRRLAVEGDGEGRA